MSKAKKTKRSREGCIGFLIIEFQMCENAVIEIHKLRGFIRCGATCHMIKRPDTFFNIIVDIILKNR